LCDTLAFFIISPLFYMANPQRRSQLINNFNISDKANKVLNVVLIVMVLIILRVWHLAVIQYDKRLEDARKPQRRVVVEAARRATIRDRFNIPLAINKVQYQASILYSQFRQIPYSGWRLQEGKRVKYFKRREYINHLAKVLGDELQLDPDRLEDLIHAKASFYYHIPFVIKEDISEKEYYRLKMLEKDWVGVHVQRLPKRTYPMGKIGADIIGYMGAINKQEYESIIHQMNDLEKYVHMRERGEDAVLPKDIDSPAHAYERLKELQERAYTINDYVGKMGIEGRFDEQLRGFQGKKVYYSDARGNFLRELPGSREALSGERFLLTISSELQAYAEELLIQNENVRETQVTYTESGTKISQNTTPPWIKGGAIVAMDPKTGEVVTLASYPRFDPNDFIASGNPEVSSQKRSNIRRWFETEDYIGEIWDQKRPLEREEYDVKKETLNEQAKMMTWENYLEMILPNKNPIIKGLTRISKLENAIRLQQSLDLLISLGGVNNLYTLFNELFQEDDQIPHRKSTNVEAETVALNFAQSEGQISQIRKSLATYFVGIPNHYDKVLLCDLVRLVTPIDHVAPQLLNAIGKQSLSTYRESSACIAILSPILQLMAKEIFHEVHFKTWRKENEKDFLKQKRLEETQKGVRYPKPYIDFLDEIESDQFEDFWLLNRWELFDAFLNGSNPTTEPEIEPYLTHFENLHKEILHGANQALPWKPAYDKLKRTLASLNSEQIPEYLKTLRTYREMTRPLFGKYAHLRKSGGLQLEKNLAAAFYPVYGYGFARSQAYRQASTQGSIFKLVTAYEALIQRYKKLDESKRTFENLNPLSIIDNIQRRGKEVFVGYHENGKSIPQLYKGGRLPRSISNNLGEMDVLRAIETSSNPYFALLAGDVLESPSDLANAARLFSYGARTGIDLSAEIGGSIPKDLEINRTGLYSTSIGQHTLVVTPLQTAVMLSSLVNGGKILKPKIVQMTAGRQAGHGKNSISRPLYFPYKDALGIAGIDFPLFTAVTNRNQKNLIKPIPTIVVREIFMPKIVQRILLEGMHRVVFKMQQTAIGSLSKLYHNHPEAISDFIDLKHQMYGKTSTSESIEYLNLDQLQGNGMYTHVWFGGVVFDEKGNPSQNKNSFLFKDTAGEPDLVIVVYLRYGKFGKEAAPVAAQIYKKWQEIKASHNTKVE